MVFARNVCEWVQYNQKTFENSCVEIDKSKKTLDPRDEFGFKPISNVDIQSFLTSRSLSFKEK